MVKSAQEDTSITTDQSVMASVSLPCFEGYDQFVIWSTPDSVSRLLVYIIKLFRFEVNHMSLFLFNESFDNQITSCYGLLSTEVIQPSAYWC